MREVISINGESGIYPTRLHRILPASAGIPAFQSTLLMFRTVSRSGGLPDCQLVLGGEIPFLEREQGTHNLCGTFEFSLSMPSPGQQMRMIEDNLTCNL